MEVIQNIHIPITKQCDKIIWNDDKKKKDNIWLKVATIN